MSDTDIMKSPADDRGHPNPAAILQLYGPRIDRVDFIWTLPDGTQSAMTIHLRNAAPSPQEGAP